MLTFDDADAFATSAALVCLVSERLIHHRPGDDLCLSPQAAESLADVLQLLRTALFDARQPLADASSDKAHSR